MKPSSLLRCCALTFVLACSASVALFGQDTTPPVVAVPISDFTVPANSAPTVINLKKTFALSGVKGKLVRFSTSVGNVDVEMLSDAAPQTVAAFLKYANTSGNNELGIPTYSNTLIHRVISGFIVQGGGFYINPKNQLSSVPLSGSIPSEAGVSNTSGTLAVALSTGPDSGTGEWFFNIADNSASLDGNNNGGPFTVFGRVINNGSTLDAIVALPNYDLTPIFGNSLVYQNFPSLRELPIVNGMPDLSDLRVNDLVYTNSITPLPLTPKGEGGTAALVLKVKGNTNPDLVTATIDVRKLTLTYAPGKTGTATFRVMAKSVATKSKTFATFTVTVQ